MRNNKLLLKAAKVQEMSGQEVRGFIGEDNLRRIEVLDGHPFFVELLVAHEGVSRGKIMSAGKNPAGTRKFWSRARIEELAARLKSKPVPVYLFHDSGNRPRKKVGEILSSLTKTVADRFSALAFAYITDPAVRDLIRRGKLNTCSLEADLVFEPNDKNPGISQWIVNAIESVSGVALGSREVSRPGFAGTAILAQAEEFEDAGIGADAEETEQRKARAEAELRARENELAKLRSELENLKKEREREERKRKVAEIAGRQMGAFNLKRKEQQHLLEEVGERIELKAPANEQLEQAVKTELEREVRRLAELRGLYQRPGTAPAPLEPGDGLSKNPLIPND